MLLWLLFCLDKKTEFIVENLLILNMISVSGYMRRPESA